MCRMIAFASSDPVDVSPFLGKLSDLARCGNLVEGWEKRPGGNHPNGWGIAFRNSGGIDVRRSGNSAWGDPAFEEVRARSDRFIGHVRYASNTATVNAANSHPFFADGVALAHNGTFYGTLGDEADRRNVSDTLIFLERLCALWKDRTFPKLKETIEKMLNDPALVGDYSAANLFIATGGSLFALRRYRRNEDYYTLYVRTSPGSVVAASQPLDDGQDWRLLGNGELVDMGGLPSGSVSLDVIS
ncbi:MAG: class II glutamine amidotransferase [Deltaproteobacteria bacterium]|nr:class II glutamine amidotransferase [Deltaproteobacteria bacterium]